MTEKKSPADKPPPPKLTTHRMAQDSDIHHRNDSVSAGKEHKKPTEPPGKQGKK